MAKGIKTGGRDFKPGHPGNPLGARSHNKDMKLLRRLTNIEIAEIGTLVLEGNLDRLQAIKDQKSASVLKVWIASVAVKAISKGDAHALDVLLNRIAGKVKDQVHITGEMSRTELDMSDEDVQDLKEKLIKRIQGRAAHGEPGST